MPRTSKKVNIEVDEKICKYGDIKIALALMASGSSKRFGSENKLLVDIYGKYLYQYMCDKLLNVKKFLIDGFNIPKVELFLVTRYIEIINDNQYNNFLNMIYNENADLGKSSSIKCAIENAKDYDYIFMINSDMPKLSETSIVNLIIGTIENGKKIGALYNKKPKNPAIFHKSLFDEVYNVTGDVGPKYLFDKYENDLWTLTVDDDQMFEIDTIDDFKNL